ncbi:MAG: glycosyltransferase family 2 protein [Sporocytophaga sp.]|uniref:glycosyltransferase family 2 protein n=1 Tax=Sporocytophaga sp. TaxID=2231183 RepID=UPI001B008B22|nr:glycosyltransferase family 2 protein [Sporocytophaga sp.]MBO9699693.1 glycosyltransferase family 2 protein [Sporocytophaga sp.]
MESDFYKLSIALVTRNRSQNLKSAIESLKGQSIQPYEILVSDDSDIDSVIKQNIEICKSYNCIYFTGPRKGLYANRNFVAEKCNGSHIRTMDDDHEFPENHLKECFDAIARDPDAIWTIGEYCPPNEERSLPAPIPGQLHPKGYSCVPADMNGYFGISCGATIYPRSVIESKVLNLETYKFGILYLEYGIRLKKNGFNIKHIQSTFVIHKSYATTASELQNKTIEECRIFCMLMLTFKHQVSIFNVYSTTSQLIFELIKGKISFRILLNAFEKYRLESSKM